MPRGIRKGLLRPKHAVQGETQPRAWQSGPTEGLGVTQEHRTSPYTWQSQQCHDPTVLPGRGGQLREQNLLEGVRPGGV